MGTQGGGPADVDVRLLGPIEVRRGGRAIDVPGGRARSLLTILALQVGQAIPAERLIDTLWGDEVPATAKTVLQGFVSKLRQALGATALETAGKSYRLAVPRSAIDANRFHDLVRAARDLGGDERTATLDRALALWRDQPCRMWPTSRSPKPPSLPWRNTGWPRARLSSAPNSTPECTPSWYRSSRT